MMKYDLFDVTFSVLPRFLFVCLFLFHYEHKAQDQSWETHILHHLLPDGSLAVRIISNQNALLLLIGPCILTWRQFWGCWWLCLPDGHLQLPLSGNGAQSNFVRLWVTMTLYLVNDLFIIIIFFLPWTLPNVGQ